MTITVSGNWKRALERALRQGLKATKRVDGTYRVPSVSEPGKFHILTLDPAGHIAGCSECLGWERYGRGNPCKHAGAVAIARAFELGAHLVVRSTTVESSYRGKSHVFRQEVGA